MERKRPKRFAIVIFVIGAIALVAGVATLIIKKTSQPLMDDAEFLITAGEWVREDQPNVIWNFTEVGEGKLTTDGHLNDYDFIWKLQDGKLSIETGWYYDLEDEFTYSINQSDKTMRITNSDKAIEVNFYAQEKPEQDTEAQKVELLEAQDLDSEN